MSTDATASPRADSKRWWALGVISLAQLLVVLDATIVNIALPSAQSELGMLDADRQWVITAYALAFGALLLLGGRISGAIGHRRAFIIGLVALAATSALAGAATEPGVLFTARALQGASAALLAPAALTLLSMTFTDAGERGKAFGVFAGVGAGGAALGVVVGGLLTEYVDWRWCLFINIPMAVIALLGTPLMIRPAPFGSMREVDVPGVLLSGLAMVALVYAFGAAESGGWGDPLVVGLIVGGLVLLGLFVLVESRTAHPLLPLHIVTHRTRGAAYGGVFLMFVAMFGFYLFVSYYAQTVLGYSAVETGLTLLVNAVATMIGSMVIANLLYGRVPAAFLIAGSLVVAALGMLVLTGLTADTTDVFVAHLLPAQVLTGLGFGCVLAVAANVVTVGTDPTEAGIASGTYNAVQQLGAALGTSLLNSVATGVAAAYVATHAADGRAVAVGTVEGYTSALWVAFGVLTAGAIAVVASHRRSADRTSEPVPT